MKRARQKAIFILVGLLVLTLVGYKSGFSESVFILQPNLKTVKFKSVIAPGTAAANITKPVCPAGWVQEIFVTPAVASAYSSAASNALNVMAMVQASAKDNGDGTWTALMQVKDNQGNLLQGAANENSRLRMLVETMCCPAGGSCI